MQGIAVLVIRYTHPGDREYRVPLNFHLFGKEIPMGLALITLMLFLIAIVNLFTKPSATVAGIDFFVRHVRRFHRFRDTSRIAIAAPRTWKWTNSTWPRRKNFTAIAWAYVPGSILVPVSNYHALYHLQAVLDRVNTERRDVVVLHVRLLRRAASGSSELEAEQLFGSVEQFLFTKALSHGGKARQDRFAWPLYPPMICGAAF